MAGRSSRRDEGSFTISNTNGFSALESLRKKKKSDKVKKSKSSSQAPSKEPEPQVFWAQTSLNAKSWADVDDDDDDDFYATAAPPQDAWRVGESEQSKAATLEESESEDDMLDLGDDDLEEDHEHEEVIVHPEPSFQKEPEILLPVKESERQLSKKERKKKELEELDALLADFGVSEKDGNGQGCVEEKKDGEVQKEQASDKGDKKDGVVPSESKNAKKKKKKEKMSSKESKEAENETNGGADIINGHPSDPTGTEEEEEDASTTVDVKERLKKVSAAKKKKSGKELGGAAKAAANEAAARNAKLAAAKKKEKNHHYNQQPVR